MKLRILNIDYHRNGIAGAPFHAIVFRDAGPESSVKLAVVFDARATTTSSLTCFTITPWSRLSIRPWRIRAGPIARRRAAGHMPFTRRSFAIGPSQFRTNSTSPNQSCCACTFRVLFSGRFTTNRE